VEKNNRADRMT